MAVTTARSLGLMTGLISGWLGGQAKRFSGSGDISESQEVQLSVAGKPNELAERAGESGDDGEAELDVKSAAAKSSVSKRTGEKSS